MKILKPKPLRQGDTIGIFTPSWPAHLLLRDKYLHALTQLEKAGFSYYEGFLTKSGQSEGYRIANGKLRAEEFMELVCNPKVHCLMATIGGWNSSSMLPFLDFEEIRKQRKIVCGYSDITALHLAILKYSCLGSFYGPSVVPTFGEYPSIMPYALESFLDLASGVENKKRELLPPLQYNKQFIDAIDSQWREKEAKREFSPNEGWKVLSEGRCSGPLIVVNLETLLALAGTPIFPDLRDRILVLEEEEARFSLQERAYSQLLQIGIFDQICGLVISKPFFVNSEEASFSHEELVLEIVGKRNYPIVCNFDCGHTFPSMTLPIGISATLEARQNQVKFYLDESAVSAEGEKYAKDSKN